MYYQAVFAVLLLLNAPILWYKHRWNRIWGHRVIKEMAPMSDPTRRGRAGIAGDASSTVSPSPWDIPGQPRRRCRNISRHRTRLGWHPQDGHGPAGVDSGRSHHGQPGRHGRRSIGDDCSTVVHRHRRLVERGALQENITAQSWVEISRRNRQGTWPRPPTICPGNGVDLPAG